MKVTETTEDSEKKSAKSRPKAGKDDVAHTIARAGLSMIPVVGGAAKELFTAIVTPPLVKRRDEWIESIGRKLNELEERVQGFRIENLSQNEVFITTVTYATTIAVRSHQEEKIEALRNAVLNSALPSAPNEDLQYMFLDFVDILLPWHMKFLKFLDDTHSWMKEHNINEKTLPTNVLNTVKPIEDSTCFEFIECVLDVVFPELSSAWYFAVHIVRDLLSHGLIMEARPLIKADFVYRPLPPRSWTTTFGKQFMLFISSPLEKPVQSGRT